MNVPLYNNAFIILNKIEGDLFFLI